MRIKTKLMKPSPETFPNSHRSPSSVFLFNELDSNLFTRDSRKCSKTRKRSISVITGVEETKVSPFTDKIVYIKKNQENLQIITTGNFHEGCWIQDQYTKIAYPYTSNKKLESKLK